ncbi:MAG: FAD-binding oxidoreductase [Candidatus Dormibacteria bacterium]
MSVPPPLRWWGWGERATAVPPGLARLLRDQLGVGVLAAAAPPPPMPRLPESRASASLLAALRAACGDVGVRTDDECRLRHAAGRSYLDLVRLRSGDVGEVPDAVVFPQSEAAVAAVLAACAAGDSAVVPFGGGTSVVGGVTPLRGAHQAVVTLSTRRLEARVAIDDVSLTATLGAGLTGPEAEAGLNRRGLTLGHFPQSFEYATIGGFAATRSSGQASSGYGRFDEMALGLRCVTPSGTIVVAPHPASAAGPSARELLLGSEGRMGVITEVTVRVRRAPAARRYEGWSFRTFAEGVAALRAMAQGHVVPDVARLSDAEETRAGMAMAAHGGVVESLGRRYLEARGHSGGCLLILGWDSDARVPGARRAAAHSLVRQHGGVGLGATPGRSWLKGRYAGPYLRDALIDSGVLVETLETATSWSRLDGLREAVVGALHRSLRQGGAEALVGAHVSHVYASGASLYLTVLAPAGDAPAERWRAAKTSATEAILDNGGTLTHHHAVGTDHAPFMHREVSAAGLASLGAAIAAADPQRILNPGKLLVD